MHLEKNAPNSTVFYLQNETGGGTGSIGGTKGGRISVTSNGSEQKTGLEVKIAGTGTGQQNALFVQDDGLATGSFNRGLVSLASNNSVDNIAGAFFADGNLGTNYVLQISIGGTQANTKYGAYISSSGSGTKYGIFSTGETYNYFNGNVGIGIGNMTPGRALSVYSQSGAGNLSIISASTGTSVSDGFSISNDGSTSLFMTQHENADWNFVTNGGTNAFTIKPSAFIGFGTNAPAQKLHVEGGRLRIATGANYLDVYQSGTQSVFEASNTFAVAANGGGVKFNMDDGDANFDLAVHVNGLFQIKDGTEGAGKVLTSDGAGNTKWQNPIIFRGLFAPTGALTITATPQIIGGTISYSGSVLYNTSPGGFGGSMTVGNMRFRAPEQGYYQIHANVYVSINPNQNVMIEAYNLTTSSVIASTLVRNPDASAQMFYTMDISAISLLNVSDDVVIRILGGGASSGLIVSNSNYNNFEVNLIR